MSLLSTLAPLILAVSVIAAIAWGIIRALLLDEIRGRIKRRAEANVKETLASMGPELRAEYEKDWLAELDSLKSMPFSAMAFARGIRQSAGELMGAPALASAETTDNHVGAPAGRGQRQVKNRLGGFSRRLKSWLSLELQLLFSRSRRLSSRPVFHVAIGGVLAGVLWIFRGSWISVALGAVALAAAVGLTLLEGRQ